jgi:hypothetical protein
MKLTPNLDNFTKGVNKTIPSATENLPPLARKSLITNSIESVKGSICNRIDGAIDLISGIKSGANNILNEIKNFEIDTFFEGPIEQLTEKIDDVVSSFKTSFDNFRKQEFNLEKTLDTQIENINAEMTERFESTKIAIAGFKDSMGEIKNFSNNKIRDINESPDLKNNLTSSLCKQSEEDMVDNALTETSNTQLADNQENLLEESNKLIKILPQTVSDNQLESVNEISGFVSNEVLPEFIEPINPDEVIDIFNTANDNAVDRINNL